jgi:benzoate membrane transport protein
VVVALVTILLGMTGWFEKILRVIPHSIAAAVLGGVLFPFVIKIAGAALLSPVLVGAMIAAFVVMRLVSPRWMIAVVTLVAIMGSVIAGKLDLSQINFQLAAPQLIMPVFSLAAVFDIAVPMLLITLTGQYLPGFAILKANGFTPPADALVRLCGLASLLSAPFGNHTVNPAAIIAGIAAGSDSHADPSKRWLAGISAGITYLVFGSFAGTFVALFAGLPPGLVAALAGLALLGTVTNALATALADVESRDAALLTFAVTASGVTIAGMSAALVGLLAGLILLWSAKLYTRLKGGPRSL